jgi:predicted nuclease with TOPRIM domain
MTLTQTDLDEIEKIFDERIEERTKNLPTKKEFYNKMDEVVGELKAIREELLSINHQLSNHEDRISNVEKKLEVKPSIA